MAQRLEIHRPAFLSDAAVIVDCLLDKTMRTVISPIILDCKDLLANFNDVAIMFIRREVSTDAHKLVSVSKSLGNHVWTYLDHLASLASMCDFPLCCNDSVSH